jgi:formylglycine-generating enzyme required for sulfatase activity
MKCLSLCLSLCLIVILTTFFQIPAFADERIIVRGTASQHGQENSFHNGGNSDNTAMYFHFTYTYEMQLWTLMGEPIIYCTASYQPVSDGAINFVDNGNHNNVPVSELKSLPEIIDMELLVPINKVFGGHVVDYVKCDVGALKAGGKKSVNLPSSPEWHELMAGRKELVSGGLYDRYLQGAHGNDYHGGKQAKDLLKRMKAAKNKDVVDNEVLILKADLNISAYRDWLQKNSKQVSQSKLSLTSKAKRNKMAKEEWKRRSSAIAKAKKLIEESKKSGQNKYAGKMIEIPTGSFMMGSNENSKESPTHRVNILSFYMGETEVTNEQWLTCFRAGSCSSKAFSDSEGYGSSAVTNVSFNDITGQFIPWLNKATGKVYRLPSEAEWEYAARAGATTKYSWGNSIGKDNILCRNCNHDNNKSRSVKMFKANNFGLFDMHGNVSEIVQDCWNKTYHGAPSDGSSWLSGKCSWGVSRGGDSGSKPKKLTSSYRSSTTRGDKNYSSRGFRLAQDKQ